MTIYIYTDFFTFPQLWLSFVLSVASHQHNVDSDVDWSRTFFIHFMYNRIHVFEVIFFSIFIAFLCNTGIYKLTYH